MYDSYEVIRLLQAISGKLDTVISHISTLSSNSGTISANTSDGLSVLQSLQTSISQFFGKFDWSVLYGALAVLVLCSIVNSFLKRGWLN